jgi:predicted small integral membrane protein
MHSCRIARTACGHCTKEFAIAGCVIAEVLLFGGFVVIAEGWYEMWRSGRWSLRSETQLSDMELQLC